MKSSLVLACVLGAASLLGHTPVDANEITFLHATPGQSGVYQIHYDYEGTSIEYPRYWREKGVDLYETSRTDPNFFKAGTRVDVEITWLYEITLTIVDSQGNKFIAKGQDARRLINPVDIYTPNGEIAGEGVIKFDPKQTTDSQRIGFWFAMNYPHRIDGFPSPQGDFYHINPEQQGWCVFEDGFQTPCDPSGAKTWIISSGGFED